MPRPVRVAYIVRSWPRLSQTFIVNEILALERIGVAVSIFALTSSSEAMAQPQVRDVTGPLCYLDSREMKPGRAHFRVAARSPRRYVATLIFALRSRELLGGYTRSTGRGAFDRAVLVADQLRRQGRRGFPPTRVHAHFAHDPALVGVLVHRLTGLPFSFTAHARDLYQIPVAALVGRLRHASVVVTCCQANAAYIERTCGGTHAPVALIYHGVDLEVFGPARPAPQAARDVPVLVSVGRLVKKKGFADLLAALALLSGRGFRFRCEIYGDGPCEKELIARRDELGLGDVVAFPGPRTQHGLVAAYQAADLFVLTPRVTDDGDRDGVPNVILEAMACGLPIVTTPVGGIAEVVTHGVNGLMARPTDPAAIAACIQQLLADPARRVRLGAAGARRATLFDSRDGAHRLARLFGHEPDPAFGYEPEAARHGASGRAIGGRKAAEAVDG